MRKLKIGIRNCRSLGLLAGNNSLHSCRLGRTAAMILISVIHCFFQVTIFILMHFS